MILLTYKISLLLLSNSYTMAMIHWLTQFLLSIPHPDFPPYPVPISIFHLYLFKSPHNLKPQFLLFLTSYIVPCNLSVIFSIPPFPLFSLFTVPLYLSVSAMTAASLALSRILHYQTQYLKSFQLFLFIFPIGHIPHFKPFFLIFYLCSSKSHHLFISCPI